VAAISLAPIGLSMLAIVEASFHAKRDFYEAGSSKRAWIVVTALFTFFYVLGSSIALYLIRVRPKVRNIEAHLTQSLS
jgi:hypothetical protein